MAEELHPVDYSFDYADAMLIQVKIGACEKHLPALKALHEATSSYGVLRQCNVEAAGETPCE